MHGAAESRAPGRMGSRRKYQEAFALSPGGEGGSGRRPLREARPSYAPPLPPVLPRGARSHPSALPQCRPPGSLASSRAAGVTSSRRSCPARALGSATHPGLAALAARREANLVRLRPRVTGFQQARFRALSRGPQGITSEGGRAGGGRAGVGRSRASPGLPFLPRCPT